VKLIRRLFMETKVIDHGEDAEIWMKGHLDTRTAGEADKLFAEVGETHQNVTLDFAELSYISSAGIRALRNLYMILYRKGGKLLVINPNENVRDVFEMTGLTTLWE
jgi:anti-sigma B factor antagonist